MLFRDAAIDSGAQFAGIIVVMRHAALLCDLQLSFDVIVHANKAQRPTLRIGIDFEDTIAGSGTSKALPTLPALKSVRPSKLTM